MGRDSNCELFSKKQYRNLTEKWKETTDPLKEGAGCSLHHEPGKKTVKSPEYERERNYLQSIHPHYENWKSSPQEKALTPPSAQTDIGSGGEYTSRTRSRKSLLRIPSLQCKPREAIPDSVTEEFKVLPTNSGSGCRLKEAPNLKFKI